MLDAYRQHVAERAALGIPPTPLSPAQVAELIELLNDPPEGEAEFLLELITERVPPGVDEAAYVKAGFLSAIAKGESQCPLIDRTRAILLLGDMHGGYNIGTLIALIDDEELGRHATRDDCWIALRGRVYNLTGYVDYHPGGEKILEQTYGKDATALFDKYHKYVNGEYIMAATQVGIRPGYVPDSDSE